VTRSTGSDVARGKAPARRRPTTDPRAQRESARVRAASLARLLLAIAPSQGAAVTLTISTRAGAKHRATYSHQSVLFYLRRAIADAHVTAASRARARSPLPKAYSDPARRAVSA
jgi:hypothetical protein